MRKDLTHRVQERVPWWMLVPASIGNDRREAALCISQPATTEDLEEILHIQCNFVSLMIVQAMVLCEGFNNHDHLLAWPEEVR